MRKNEKLNIFKTSYFGDNTLTFSIEKKPEKRTMWRFRKKFLISFWVWKKSSKNRFFSLILPYGSLGHTLFSNWLFLRKAVVPTFPVFFYLSWPIASIESYGYFSTDTFAKNILFFNKNHIQPSYGPINAQIKFLWQIFCSNIGF